MAVKLLQVLVLGVIAAATDDVPVSWLSSRGSLPCQVPSAERITARRPPPPLDAEDRTQQKPYVWLRGDDELKRVSSNGTLEVSKRRDLEGIYQCSIKHQGGVVLGYPVNLKFAYLEKQFSVHPLNATAWRGQPFVLTCDITSGPPATVSWLRNSKPLPSNTRYLLVKNQLLITEVTQEDAGLYRCKATNYQANKSRTSHSGRLVVENSPEDLPLSFLPVLHDGAISAPRGSKVVLACPIVGNHKPKLIWELTAPGERTGELEFVEENLVLSNIQLDQGGMYSCRAEGNSGLVKTFNVTITEPVSITHAPESKQAVRASTVRFNCTASGRPLPHVTWYKDGKELQLTRRIDVVLSAGDNRYPQLLIRGVTSDDAGVYQCFARNGVSVASAWGILNVTGAEVAAPESLRCWPVGASDVVLNWTSVPHKVIAYTVQTTLPGGGSFPEQPVTTTNVSLKLKSPLTPYGFQVRAFINSPLGKKNEASDMSETVICQGQGVPIHLAKVENDDVLVSWQQFYEENPGVVQWILQYKLENSSEEHNVTMGGHVYTYTLKMSPSKPVQVRVLGTRSLPWQDQDLSHVPWRSSAAASHQLAPGEVLATPVNVEVVDVNPRNMTVRWECQNQERYSYLVCLRRVPDSQNDECVDSYITTVKIDHLKPDTEYELRVQAKLLGKMAGGDFSAPIQTSTPPEEDLQYAYTTSGVVVRWHGSGPRSVRYSQNLTQPIQTWYTINTTESQNHVQITGLDPLLSTFVMVAAPGPNDQRRQVLTIKPPPVEDSNIYLYIGISCGILLLCLLGAAAVCVWHKRKARSRTRTRSPIEGTEEDSTQLKSVGGRLANGGGSKDAGEPLLNGHIHITENPSQSKTPNGRVRKGQLYQAAPFDVSRHDDADITLETVLDNTNTTLNFFDTSRRPEFDHRHPDVSLNASFNKLPDDNMNSEITRSSFELDNSGTLPTLQPNG